MRKLPFAAGIFWKTLAGVAVLVIVGWWVVLGFTSYEKMIPADYGGTIISTILLAYLVHLWLMPADEAEPDDKPPTED